MLLDLEENEISENIENVSETQSLEILSKKFFKTSRFLNSMKIRKKWKSQTHEFDKIDSSFKEFEINFLKESNLVKVKYKRYS